MSSSDLLRLVRQENARLKDEHTLMQNELQRLRRAIHALRNLEQRLDQITPKTNVQNLVEDILFSALSAVDSENGSLLLLDEDTGDLVFVDAYGPYRERLIGYRLPRREGIASWVFQERTAQLVPDVRQNPHFTPLVDEHLGFHSNSLICVPIQNSERALGVLEVVNKRDGEPFVEADLDILLLIGRLASIALFKAEGRWRKN